MNDIIEKLNLLKTVQPTEDLVVKMRTEVLSKAPVSVASDSNTYNNSIFDINFKSLLASKLAMSFAAFIFVISGGFVTVIASGNSLPGDALYSVKMASESVELAVASQDEKVEIEIQQAGKRLDEMKEISKRPDDVDQGKIFKQLAVSFKKKVDNAQDGLTKIEDSDKKAKIAKVINTKTENYTEGLVEAKDNLANDVKNDVSEKLASASDSNKKVNFDSLAVMIGITDDNKDDIIAKINDEIDQLEVDIEALENKVALIGENSNICEIGVINEDIVEKSDINVVAEDENVSDGQKCVEIQPLDYQIVIEGIKEEIKKAKQDLEDNNLLDAINIITEIQKTIVELENSISGENKPEEISDMPKDETDDSVEDLDEDKDEDGEIKGDVDEAVDPKEEENNEEETAPAEEELTPVEGILPPENI